MIAQQGTLEISRSRLRHNLAVLRALAGKAALCATVKADAYGHGIAETALLLLTEDVKWVGVYSLEEAAGFAGMGWEGILVLAPLVLDQEVKGDRAIMLSSALNEAVRVNVTDVDTARRLSFFAQSHLQRVVKVHVQVDAGLTRMGVHPTEAANLAEQIRGLPGLVLEGLFAHFSHGDVRGHETVDDQLSILQQVAEPLKRRNPELMVHLQNSGGICHLPDTGLDMVRIGIALYGLQPSMEDRMENLLPIARLIAPVLAIHERPAGTGVGYGHTFVTSRASRLAVVPVGYAEGYPRTMSNRAVAQIRGMDVPVVGRVSMDQIIVDVTDVESVRLGEPVTVISWDPAAPNSLDMMAKATGTIGYELATHLGGRLRRVIVD